MIRKAGPEVQIFFSLVGDVDTIQEAVAGGMLESKIQISCETVLLWVGWGQLNLDVCQQAGQILNNHVLPQMNEPFDAEKFKSDESKYMKH